MIAALEGILAGREPDGIVVDVGGVGYLVAVSARTLGSLPEEGERVRLRIETQVREDSIRLFGFADAAERAAFRLLLGVQGVGARIALSILSALSPEEIAAAIAAGDKVAFARAEGVGPKLAARIASELRGKEKELAPVSALPPSPSSAPFAPVLSGTAEDAVSALVNLGWKRSEAAVAVDAVRRHVPPDAPVGTLIRAALKQLAA